MLNSSTPRKLDQGGDHALLKKPRFDLVTLNNSSGVHDMSGIEQQLEQANRAQEDLVVTDADLFRLQLQNAFQELSDQVNRVGTHLSQQVEMLQNTVSRVVASLQKAPLSRKRSLHQVAECSEASDVLEDTKTEESSESVGDESGRAAGCRLTVVYTPGGEGADKKTTEGASNKNKNKKKKLIRCHYCLRRQFRQHASLMAHIRRDHIGHVSKPYVCALCSVAFHTAALCQKHVKSAHSAN